VEQARLNYHEKQIAFDRNLEAIRDTAWSQMLLIEEELPLAKKMATNAS